MNTAAEIKIEEKEDYAILNLSGDFNTNEDCENLRASFKAIVNKDITKAIINLEGADYLSSSTLSALMSGNSIMNRVSGKIAIYNVNDYIKHIFSITKLDTIFTICPDIDSALEHINHK